MTDNRPTLSALRLGNVRMASSFDPSVREYTGVAEDGRGFFDFIAEATDENAVLTYSLNGNALDPTTPQNERPLRYGDNEFVVSVTVGGDTGTYAVNVIRLDTSLAGLEIGTLTLEPAFAPLVYEYTATTSNATNKVTVTPNDESATVEILVEGTEIENGTSATWIQGPNDVEINVSNGPVTETYLVRVEKRDH